MRFVVFLLLILFSHGSLSEGQPVSKTKKKRAVQTKAATNASDDFYARIKDIESEPLPATEDGKRMPASKK